MKANNNRLSVEEFRDAKKVPLTIILDNVRSVHNVGSIFRTADCFLIKKIYLCGITASPSHKGINKSALGATESVDWEYAQDAFAIVQRLQIQGHLIIALEQTSGSENIVDFQPLKDKEYVFVFGNEVHGISERILHLADKSVEIPQFGTKHSLNISNAVAIAIWDFYTKSNTFKVELH